MEKEKKIEQGKREASGDGGCILNKVCQVVLIEKWNVSKELKNVRRFTMWVFGERVSQPEGTARGRGPALSLRKSENSVWLDWREGGGSCSGSGRQGGGGTDITQDLVGHKDFDFYSELNHELLVRSEQRGNMISVVAVKTLRRLSQRISPIAVVCTRKTCTYNFTHTQCNSHQSPKHPPPRIQVIKGSGDPKEGRESGDSRRVWMTS